MEHDDFWIGLASLGAGLSFLMSYISYKEYMKYKNRYDIIQK